MKENDSITIISNRKHVTISSGSILYISMHERNSQVHTVNGRTYEARVAIESLEEQLGGRFIRTSRSCLVSVLAISGFAKKLELINGEELDYPIRKKRALNEELLQKRKLLTDMLISEGSPISDEELRRYYSAYEAAPFAFADLELKFDQSSGSIDWIIKYCNPQLASLIGKPLGVTFGKSLREIFHKQDRGFASNCRRAVFFGEILESVEPKPGSAGYVKEICFPSFPGHCGLMLFDLSSIRFTHSGTDSNNALLQYLGMITD